MVTDHLLHKAHNGHARGLINGHVNGRLLSNRGHRGGGGGGYGLQNELNESSSSPCTLKSVCIVGAGAAGLVALRHFAERLKDHQFEEIVCYEQSAKLGGTWNYTERVGVDESGSPIHSSMYRDLHTNLPIQIMEFPDFPSNYTKSYVHHTKVRRYLQLYADHYSLERFIRYRHRLRWVTRDEEHQCWSVTVENHNETIDDSDDKDEEVTVERRNFDILILCLGRHSLPYWPPIESLRHFDGNVIHSHDYRSREPYIGHRVAVIGGGPSGFDICSELSTVAREVIFINRTEYQFEGLPQNVLQLNGNIMSFGSNSMVVRFDDDKNDQNGDGDDDDKEENVQMKQKHEQQYQLDSVVMATGYRFDLRYLDQKCCGIHLLENDTLDGLYKQMINIAHPTMLMLGVCQHGVLPFPMYHQQIQYYIKFLLNELTIPTPTKEEMLEATNQEIHHQQAVLGYRSRDRHSFKNLDTLIQYIRSIEADAQLIPLERSRLQLHIDLYQVRLKNVVGFKRLNYRLVDDERYEEV